LVVVQNDVAGLSRVGQAADTSPGRSSNASFIQ
jgi:hypothetical protein